MKLSLNFWLSEFTESPTAKRLYIENEPNNNHIANLTILVTKILQPIRDRFGAIHITSGYRSKELNKAIGGSSSSQHPEGKAADFKCEYMSDVFEYIKQCVDFDQLIWEFGDDDEPSWIHVSYNQGENRNQALKAIKENGKTKYITL